MRTTTILIGALIAAFLALGPVTAGAQSCNDKCEATFAACNKSCKKSDTNCFTRCINERNSCQVTCQ
jgi:hypothetical protein